jgi:hypothetical protein
LDDDDDEEEDGEWFEADDREGGGVQSRDSLTMARYDANGTQRCAPSRIICTHTFLFCIV